MPDGDPVSLTSGIVAAIVGGMLAAFLVVRIYLDLRQRRALRAQGPDLSGFDPDVKRYLDRVWLLVAAWTPRLQAEESAEVLELWGVALAGAHRLQEKRSADNEVAEDVAEMVALEEEIGSRINAALRS